MNQGETCQGPSGNIRLYQLTFQTGSVVDTENVNIARCTAGRCSHTFEPPSNPPSSYDSVLVAAENVVGVGAARTCTTQPISELSCYSLDTDWSTGSSHAKHLSCTSRLCVVRCYGVVICTYKQWNVLCSVKTGHKTAKCKHMCTVNSQNTPLPFSHYFEGKVERGICWNIQFVFRTLHCLQLTLVRLAITMIAIAFFGRTATLLIQNVHCRKSATAGVDAKLRGIKATCIINVDRNDMRKLT